jgi:D-mannonate dehydratase
MLLVSESKVLENYQWFIQQVIPVAEANGVKIALHPDDRPLVQSMVLQEFLFLPMR